MSTVSLSKAGLENMVNQEYTSDANHSTILSSVSVFSDPDNYNRPTLEELITSAGATLTDSYNAWLDTLFPTAQPVNNEELKQQIEALQTALEQKIDQRIDSLDSVVAKEATVQGVSSAVSDLDTKVDSIQALSEEARDAAANVFNLFDEDGQAGKDGLNNLSKLSGFATGTQVFSAAAVLFILLLGGGYVFNTELQTLAGADTEKGSIAYAVKNARFQYSNGNGQTANGTLHQMLTAMNAQQKTAFTNALNAKIGSASAPLQQTLKEIQGELAAVQKTAEQSNVALGVVHGNNTSSGTNNAERAKYHCETRRGLEAKEDEGGNPIAGSPYARCHASFVAALSVYNRRQRVDLSGINTQLSTAIQAISDQKEALDKLGTPEGEKVDGGVSPSVGGPDETAVGVEALLPAATRRGGTLELPPEVSESGARQKVASHSAD
jgi:hypothetical protein